MARAQQPVAVPWTCSLIDENLVDSGFATFQVQLTGDMPVVFDPLSVSR